MTLTFGPPIADYATDAEVEAVRSPLQQSIDTLRRNVFGSATNTEPISCEARLTTAYTALATGDYLMSGNMSVPTGGDPYGMFNTQFSFYRVMIPVTMRYDIEWFWMSSQTSGLAAGKVLRNCPNNPSNINTAVQTYSILSATGLPGGEGAPVTIRRTMPLSAGDWLSFAVYGSVQFNMPVNTFGGINTRFVVRGLGVN